MSEGLPDWHIAHEYVDADVVVLPSVDVTYRGTYTVDGGPAQPIRETLTLAGTTDELEVVEAHVHLVG